METKNYAQSVEVKKQELFGDGMVFIMIGDVGNVGMCGWREKMSINMAIGACKSEGLKCALRHAMWLNIFQVRSRHKKSGGKKYD